MHTERKHRLQLLVPLLAAASLLPHCSVEAPSSDDVEVAGAEAALYDSDHNGHDDFDDSWRIRKKGDRGHRRNICPVVAASAFPAAISVGQSTKVVGYAVDKDGPLRLRFQWTVSNPLLGKFANPESKRTSFQCLKDGVAHVTFAAYDGDCRREAKLKIDCKPAQPGRCGDGKVDPNETCDGSCPTSCDDNQACTVDTLTGSAAACTAICAHRVIDACTSGDGCCASGCKNPLNGGTDNDCLPTAPVCGNQIKEPGETCDDSDPNPSNHCRTTCNDSNTCTRDVMTGSAAHCNVMCENIALTACDAAVADGCCLRGCGGGRDADCPIDCGDGVLSAGETCDPISNCPTSCNDANACTTDRLLNPGTCIAQCQNVRVVACVSGDGCCPVGCCSAAEVGPGPNADTDCVRPSDCGNGKLDPGEICDNTTANKCPTTCNDGNSCTVDVLAGSPGTCNAACLHTPITTCTAPIGDACCPANCNGNNDVDCFGGECGDLVIESTELCDGNCPTSCDDGIACTIDTLVGSAATCDAHCVHVPATTPACLCGNGRLDTGETCDNSDPAHPCPAICDDLNPCTGDSSTGSADQCNLVCSHLPSSTPTCACGNGRLDIGETCDNSDPPHLCPTSCAPSTDPCHPTVLTGSATTCSAACVSQPVTSTAGGDGCCMTPTGFCNDEPDPDCQQLATQACCTCEATGPSCLASTRSCANLAGVTPPGSPRPGVSRGLLCQQIVDCIHTTHCAQDFNITDCICGVGVLSDVCFAGTFDAATGPCKDLIAAGAESNSMPVIAANFSDAAFAIGAADTVIESCDYLSCNSCL